ncbi:MAG TPA: hypothetical protein VGD43_04975 [Micromonospora sp.]
MPQVVIFDLFRTLAPGVHDEREPVAAARTPRHLGGPRRPPRGDLRTAPA